jgi:hypothetical protein
MHRRLFLTAVLALSATTAVAQAPAGSKTVEVGRVFPLLANYLRLPAADRDRFSLAYLVQRDGKPATGLTAAIIDGGQRVPVPIDEGGRVGRLPTLAQITAKRAITFDVPASVKLGMDVRFEPNVRPAAEMPAPELAAAVAQAARGAKKAAGLMRMGVPTFDRVRFIGATGGEVLLEGGRSAPLLAGPRGPVFVPAQHPTARSIRLATAPRALAIESAR